MQRLTEILIFHSDRWNAALADLLGRSRKAGVAAANQTRNLKGESLVRQRKNLDEFKRREQQLAEASCDIISHGSMLL